MTDRPVYEIVFGVVFHDIALELGLELDGAFKLVPYETMLPGELKSAIDDNILAEMDIPYHPPIEEDERIYALNFHVAGRTNDEIVIQYANVLDQYKRKIYEDYKHLAKPLFDPDA